MTMANVFIPFPGASVNDVEALVSTPAEQVLSQMEGIEHVYSVSRPGMAILTVQFKVGVPRIDAIVRLRDTMSANRDWAPPELGILEPVIKPKGIDDVPVVSLTLWSDDASHGAYELERVAHAIEVELKRVAGTREVQTLGGPGRVVRVLLDADRLASHGVTALDVRNALQLSNVTAPTGKLVRDNREIAVETGNYLESAADVRALVVGVQDRSPVYLADVAEVVDGPDQPTRYVWTGAGPASAGKALAAAGDHPAVTLQVTKKPGENAVDVARRVTQRVDELKGTIIPADVHATVTRNYGATANDKAQKPHQEAHLRHPVGRRPRLRHPRPPRGGDRRPRRGAHARLDAVRLLGVGLHAQPRVALRAHLLHRHPGRRRDRGGREHPPPPRHEGRAALRHHSRGRGRGGRPHDTGHLHGDRRPPADGLRHRPDGPVHEPDPDQREHGDAALARHRLHGHAVARVEAPRLARPRDGLDPRREARALLRLAPRAFHQRAAGGAQPPPARHRHRRGDRALGGARRA